MAQPWSTGGRRVAVPVLVGMPVEVGGGLVGEAVSEAVAVA